MMAAIWAARSGSRVILLEKNEKLGKKLYITGKGRCNLTNACEKEEFFEHVVSHPRFLYSSFYSFDNQNVMDFFEELGTPLKVERGNRVFPVSDKSSDIISALQRELRRLKVETRLFSKVTGLWVEAGAVKGVFLQGEKDKPLFADRVILAQGGLSYPSTGSTGEGFAMVRKEGHKISDCYPALVPLVVKEDYGKRLQGLSLKNVTAALFFGKKQIYQEFGELLFTHFGVSGPVILSASSYAARYLPGKLSLKIDLKPALSKEELDARLVREFQTQQNRAFKNSLVHLLPQKLIPVIVEASGIFPEKKIHEVTKEERQRLLEVFKGFSMTVTGAGEYKEAIITQGGVDVKEVNPSTMESKVIADLYFAGEMLDLDAVTGGYNLQIAWSTGYLAGISASES